MSSNSTVAASAAGDQYLTFAVDGSEYGLEILRVQEIKGYTRVTPIPRTPPHVKGVLNLRGTIVPVIDLRVRFALPEVDHTRFSVVIVLTVGTRVIGLLVDAVSDVLTVGAADRGAVPDLGGSVDTAFVAGMAKSGDRLITLLDVDRLVGGDAALAS